MRACILPFGLLGTYRRGVRQNSLYLRGLHTHSLVPRELTIPITFWFFRLTLYVCPAHRSTSADRSHTRGPRTHPTLSVRGYSHGMPVYTPDGCTTRAAGALRAGGGRGRGGCSWCGARRAWRGAGGGRRQEPGEQNRPGDRKGAPGSVGPRESDIAVRSSIRITSKRQSFQPSCLAPGVHHVHHHPHRFRH